MDDKAIAILEQLADNFEITTPVAFMMRVIGWALIKMLVWIVDGLENITNSILGIKSFYSNADFINFVDSFKPVLVILFAFNIMFIGYLIIFQKKFNREGVIANIVMALVVLVLLGAGMQKADQFASTAINTMQHYENGSTGSQIVKKNMTDLALLDTKEWDMEKLKDEKNQVKAENITKIPITESIDKDFKFSNGGSVSQIGKRVLSNTITYGESGEAKLAELDNGWFTMFDQFYYRWAWDFWTMFFTLAVMAFVLVTVAIKLAKLFFELAFNYALAIFVAPSDMHNGQKMKQVVQTILNIFIVMIMIFLSMKIYIIGTTWLGENTKGLTYLVAMFGFALAVIDGPNIVERLFGIDAGLKSSWGALAGGYALARGGAGMAKGGYNAAKGAYNKGKQAANKMPKGGMSAAAGIGGMKATQSAMNESGKEKTDNKNSNGIDQQQDRMQNQNMDTNEQPSAADNMQNEGSASGNQGDAGHNSNSSIHNEMAKANKTSNGNKPKSLHAEMKQKGYGKSDTFPKGNSQGGMNSNVSNVNGLHQGEHQAAATTAGESTNVAMAASQSQQRPQTGVASPTGGQSGATTTTRQTSNNRVASGGSSSSNIPSGGSAVSGAGSSIPAGGSGGNNSSSIDRDVRNNTTHVSRNSSGGTSHHREIIEENNTVVHNNQSQSNFTKNNNNRSYEIGNKGNQNIRKGYKKPFNK